MGVSIFLFWYINMQGLYWNWYIVMWECCCSILGYCIWATSNVLTFGGFQLSYWLCHYISCHCWGIFLVHIYCCQCNFSCFGLCSLHSNYCILILVSAITLKMISNVLMTLITYSSVIWGLLAYLDSLEFSIVEVSSVWKSAFHRLAWNFSSLCTTNFVNLHLLLNKSQEVPRSPAYMSRQTRRVRHLY